MTTQLAPADIAAAVRLLRAALGTAARVTARGEAPDGYDAQVLREGAPPIALRFRAWEPGARGDRSTVWVLNRASRGTLQALREHEENFVALNGAARLVASGFFLDRSDLPRLSVPTTPRRVDPFSDRNSLVVRTLLDEPGRRWGVREMAEAAGVATASASHVLRALAGMGAAEVLRQGRKVEYWVTNPVALVGRWAGTYSWERNHHLACAAPMGDPLRFLERARTVLDRRRCALTLQAGASLVAPHASWERIHLYVAVNDARELREVAHEGGWPLAGDGRLVLMKPYYADSVWHGLREADGLPVVSDVQLALDLWHYPLRGIEQAEHILSTRYPRR